MKVFILMRTEEVGWEEYDGKVIVAIDEARAREIANRFVGDEGKIWLDNNKVSCSEVPMVEDVVLASFNAG